MPQFGTYWSGLTDGFLSDAGKVSITDTGSTYTSTNVDGALDEIARFVKYGSGAPNGSITGVVGDRYVDTAATLGARVWYKASGNATNTGWSVAEGDTGWRNVTADLKNSWAAVTTGELQLRRVNDVVLLAVAGALTGAGASSVNFYALPTGFRPADLYSWGTAANDTGTFVASAWRAGNASVLGNVEIRSATATTSITVMRGSMTFSTIEDWPASLPGSAT